VLRQFQAELIAKEKAGVLHVTTQAGQRVDLTTFATIGTLPATPPLPTKYVDSIDFDKNDGIGVHLPQNLGGLPQVSDVSMPVLGVRDEEEVAVVQELSYQTADLDPIADPPVAQEVPAVVPEEELKEESVSEELPPANNYVPTVMDQEQEPITVVEPVLVRSKKDHRRGR
jgi:hypothetical protein